MTDISDAIPISKLKVRLRSIPKVMNDDTFHAVLDALPEAVYITDTAGRITYYNEAAAVFWGHRPEIGKSEWCGSWKLFWPDGQPLPHAECPMAIAIREMRPVRGMSAIAERPDGTRVHFAPFPTPLFDAAGDFVGAVNMLVDIGDRQRADEDAIRLASIVEDSDDAIISKDLSGIITSWNRGAARLFGYTAAEAVGQPVLMLIPPERRAEEDAILARIRKGERIDHYETVRRHKDGSLIEISLTVSPMKNSAGRVMGASKIARDITELKRAREQQALLLNEMKHRIKNGLATVQAIATQTLRSASKEDRASFGERLRALAQAHDLLTLDNWNRASLRDIVTSVLGPFRDNGHERLWIEGADGVWLNANRSVIVALMLHELATNAVKYGALSNRVGQVRVAWTKRDDAPGRVRLTWREVNGPPVQPPSRKGFGSGLIERALGDLGSANFDYRTDGLVCTLDMAL